MDWTVYPDTAISRLPRPLRYPVHLLRNILTLLRLMPKPSEGPSQPDGPDYVYEADGLATVYFSPFLADAEWSGT